MKKGAGIRAQAKNFSILLVVHNMPREAPRTIVSALPPYQKGVGVEDYEILVLDNGSTLPLSDDLLGSLPSNVRILEVPQATAMPGEALNWGASQAASDKLLFCIDGARMFSDGLVASTLEVLDRFPKAFVYTLGWHLGPDVQMRSTKEGYDQNAEDELLSRAQWQTRPEALFEISVLAGSSRPGICGTASESNAFGIARATYEQFGGYDTRFRIAGGSTSNLEIFRRYVTRPDALNICLLSEATFHQVHGGSATSSPQNIPAMFKEYEDIFGEPFSIPQFPTYFFGRPRPAAAKSLLA